MKWRISPKHGAFVGYAFPEKYICLGTIFYTTAFRLCGFGHIQLVITEPISDDRYKYNNSPIGYTINYVKKTNLNLLSY